MKGKSTEPYYRLMPGRKRSDQKTATTMMYHYYFKEGGDEDVVYKESSCLCEDM